MLDEERIPLKRAEISIQKFNDVGIPHHRSLLRNHKSNIKKCLALSDWDKIQKEEINATRVVKQLKTLLMEMDSLRSKLVREDVKKFDELIWKSRQSAMEEMKSYMELQLKSPSTSKSSFDEDDDNSETTMDIHSVPQIQTQFQLSDHQIKSREACLAQFEQLQSEIGDLHDMFNKLNCEVHSQKDGINVIADNVEVAQVQVEQGEQSLKQAVRYKKAMYPLCGGLIGMCVGGPIGMLAGAKIGAGAAVCCAFLGFTGGNVIKKQEERGEPMMEQKNE
ncbi:syntaxin-17 [Bradysia coprophila]|uniref:syntaxin-17 n=1 Tax=Bradysia coprophila TaxID=38358 RepID=UPI00187DBD07|nr:syntaxin-17 [Bradysia coprophila]